MTIFLFGFRKVTPGLASKKGIAVMAVIVAGVVAASFLVWFVPQSSPGNIVDAPRTDAEVISDVYSRHIDLASTVESDFARWQNGTLDTQSMLQRLDDSASDVLQMQSDLSRQLGQEWQRSYELYRQALDIFADYLSEIRSAVEAGDSVVSQDEIDTLKTEWQAYVEQSIESMPASRPATSEG